MVLGTQGWIPTGRRETTCLALSGAGRLVLFDAGTGLRRLLEPPGATLLAEAEELHLVLTHYHLDHVCGLAYLPGILGGREITVHVPELALSGVAPEAGVPELIRRPFNPRAWSDLPNMRLVTIREGSNDIAGLTVRARRQPHPDASVAYRVDDLFVFATDTVADPATAEFAAGVDLLLHEAWIDGVEEQEAAEAELVKAAYAAHSSARQAASLALKAGVRDLWLTHLNPLRSEAYYAQMERSARTIFASARVPTDLSHYDFCGRAR